jgi:outer membrane protein assembly factor BamD (BamD/ComL family)
MTVKEAKQAIQDLIDEFPDADFIECLEEMIDLATTSLEARREENRHEDE